MGRRPPRSKPQSCQLVPIGGCLGGGRVLPWLTHIFICLYIQNLPFPCTLCILALYNYSIFVPLLANCFCTLILFCMFFTLVLLLTLLLLGLYCFFANSIFRPKSFLFLLGFFKDLFYFLYILF